MILPPGRDLALPARRSRRSPRAWHVGSVEALEGRALLAASPIDSGFNGGQPYVLTGDSDATILNSASGVAFNPRTGDIVVVGSILKQGVVEYADSIGLAVRAFTPAGAPRAGFGTNGQATIPIALNPPPSGFSNVVRAASDVLIQSDGKIVVAANVLVVGPSFSLGTPSVQSPVETVVARLNPDGTVDTSFGTNGQTIMSTDSAQLSHLALRPDDKIVLGGTTVSGYDSRSVVTQLNADGTIDTSFNGGNLLRPPSPYSYEVDVAAAAGYTYLTYNVDLKYQVSRLDATGAVDASFGTGGVATTTLAAGDGILATVAQADGKLLVAGGRLPGGYVVPAGGQPYDYRLLRFDAAGSPDPTFAAPTLPPLRVTSIALQGDGKIVVGLKGLGAIRYNADGTPDGTFGPGAVASFYGAGFSNGVALLPGGRVVLAATASYFTDRSRFGPPPNLVTSQLIVAALRPRVPTPGDFDGDGKADVAAQLATLGTFAVRKSTGGDVLFPFGATTVGATIPVEADYDGDGSPDVAAYLPASGTFVYAPSTAPGTQISVPFGSAGAGNSIPAPGDYNGDGKVDFAVYLPAYGALAVAPSGGQAPYLFPFGSAGAGASIPAPGDYDGDGATDVAVYLPAIGALAVHPSGGGLNYLVPFGSKGAGNSIPAPGDYDGDGRTDVAVYLPQFGAFAIAPSGGAPYLVPFGSAGDGNSIPAPGDYDGDGKTDIAAYLPTFGLFAYRPSSGLPGVIQSFGAPGAGVTVPSTSIPYAQPPSVAAASVAGGNTSAGVWLALTPDVLLDATGKPKKSST